MEPGPQFLFHGTVAPLKEGDVVHPAGSGRATFPHETDRRYAYATQKPGDAWDYAEKAWSAGDSGIPHVYRVEPLGRVSKDPLVDKAGRSRGNFMGDRRSKHGFRVVGEEPMPEHMGDPEDWR